MSRSVDHALLAAARSAGRLDADTYARALEALAETPPREVWVELLDRAALLLGAALAVVGVVFLVAWNWADLGYGTKLVLAAAAVLGAGLWGLGLGVDTRPGRVSLASSAVLCGPLLVVFSQAYQTGADPWELFATWVVLVVPFAVATRVSALWLLALILAEIAVGAWGVDTRVHDEATACRLALGLAGLNAGATVAWEGAQRAWPAHASGRLVPRVAVVSGFVLALLPASWALVAPDASPAVAWLGYAAVVAAVVVAQIPCPRRDAVVIAASLAAAITLATSTLARLLVEVEVGRLGLTFVLGSALVVEAALAVGWMRAGLRRERAVEAGGAACP